uniref:Uncharacterized protein n=1 Tax=Molossus molossus TaxID=27622 RepID=A0A7J8F9E2_MOLMO|nr:hypothetical protein HJG59_008496 [Molossus molossus]
MCPCAPAQMRGPASWPALAAGGWGRATSRACSLLRDATREERRPGGPNRAKTALLYPLKVAWRRRSPIGSSVLLPQSSLCLFLGPSSESPSPPWFTAALDSPLPQPRGRPRGRRHPCQWPCAEI